MKEFLQRLKKKPWVAHLMRAVARYGNRMGAQFAAASTYFSVLAMVPVLMVGFAMLGMTVTALRPELMTQLMDALNARLSDAGLADTLGKAVTSALERWGTIGILGLGGAIYAGAGWISNLKTAIRAQWRPELEPDEKKRFFLLELLVNIATLLGLLVIGGIAVGASIVGTALNRQILEFLGLEAMPGASLLTWLVTFLVAVVGGTVLFLYLFWVMPRHRPERKPWLLGSVFAGFALAVLVTFTSLIMGLFAKNAAAAAFGPIIVVMLVFNIFAQITLFIAAWIATTNQPAVARTYNEADEPLKGRSDVELAEDHWEEAEQDRLRTEEEREAKKRGESIENRAPEDRPTAARPAWAAQRERSRTAPQPPRNDPETMVPQDVAAKGVRVGLGTGWVVGAATGVGLGAAAGRLVHWWANRPRKQR